MKVLFCAPEQIQTALISGVEPWKKVLTDETIESAEFIEIEGKSSRVHAELGDGSTMKMMAAYFIKALQAHPSVLDINTGELDEENLRLATFTTENDADGWVTNLVALYEAPVVAPAPVAPAPATRQRATR